jgi:hypothetical protein
VIDAVTLALTTALRKLPAALIPGTHIGTAAPQRLLDLPTLVLGMARTRLSVSGIGGVVVEREANPAQWEQRFADRLYGTLRLDVYAESDAETFALAGAALQLLHAERAALRAEGLLRMGETAWDRVEIVPLGTGNQRANPARQTLTMDLVFEHVNQEVPGPGGVIAEVDVRTKPPVEENLRIS